MKKVIPMLDIKTVRALSESVEGHPVVGWCRASLIFESSVRGCEFESVYLRRVDCGGVETLLTAVHEFSFKGVLDRGGNVFVVARLKVKALVGHAVIPAGTILVVKYVDGVPMFAVEVYDGELITSPVVGHGDEIRFEGKALPVSCSRKAHGIIS